MSEQSVIVWDLETIPDLAAAARMLDMSNASEAEVREALGPGFPKHPLHKIACIGALIATRQPEGWRILAASLLTIFTILDGSVRLQKTKSNSICTTGANITRKIIG
jgi:hypothetical protein